MLDKIQKEILGYNNIMSPPYFPKVVVAEVDSKWILVIVVRTGQQRPYKVPEYVTSKKDKRYSYYIRYLSNSVRANPEQERELISMSDQTHLIVEHATRLHLKISHRYCSRIIFERQEVNWRSRYENVE